MGGGVSGGVQKNGGRAKKTFVKHQDNSHRARVNTEYTDKVGRST